MSALILKLIAELTMFGDHFAAALWDTVHMSWSRDVYWVLRDVGRIAFPIFGFQLSEGVRHSTNRKKYFLRLCLFALLSEPFFDRALFGSWFHPAYQNVYLTLILAFPVLLLFRETEKYEGAEKIGLFLAALLSAILLGQAAERLFLSDYGRAGVFMMTIFAVNTLDLPKIRCDVWKEKVFRILVFVAAWGVLLYFTNITERAAFFGVIPVALYNGRQGKLSRRVRLLFYAGYPVHLAILSLVVIHLGG